MHRLIKKMEILKSRNIDTGWMSEKKLKLTKMGEHLNSPNNREYLL